MEIVQWDTLSSNLIFDILSSQMEIEIRDSVNWSRSDIVAFQEQKKKKWREMSGDTMPHSS